MHVSESLQRTCVLVGELSSLSARSLPALSLALFPMPGVAGVTMFSDNVIEIKVLVKKAQTQWKQVQFRFAWCDGSEMACFVYDNACESLGMLEDQQRASIKPRKRQSTIDSKQIHPLIECILPKEAQVSAQERPCLTG